MIKISGSSDDLIEVLLSLDGKPTIEDEYDSYQKDTLFRFADGTKLRMTYLNGTWRAIIEEAGTEMITIAPLVHNDDWYSDEFTIMTDVIMGRWKEDK